MIDNLTPTIIFNILPRGEFACWRVPSVGNVAKFRSLPIIVLDDFENLQIEYLNHNIVKKSHKNNQNQEDGISQLPEL